LLRIVEPDLLTRIKRELARLDPSLSFSTPSLEPTVLRIDGIGVLWVDDFLDGSFGLTVQDDRATNDWGSALQKRLHLDPKTEETIESAAREALAFLQSPQKR
jgi:hypothetical protein